MPKFLPTQVSFIPANTVSEAEGTAACKPGRSRKIKQAKRSWTERTKRLTHSFSNNDGSLSRRAGGHVADLKSRYTVRSAGKYADDTENDVRRNDQNQAHDGVCDGSACLFEFFRVTA